MIVLGFSFILSGILINLDSNQLNSATQVVQQYQKWMANNAANSGLNAAVSRLFLDFGWRTGYGTHNFNGSTYSVTLTDLTADSTTEAKKVKVKAIGLFGSQKDTTETVMIQPAYSYFQYFAHNWPDFMIYATGDTLNGPIHSNNGRILIAGQPVFTRKVSSHQNGYQPMTSSTPKFYGGTEFNTDTILLPDLTALKDSALANGDVYNSELWLTFHADGSYACSTSAITTTKHISDFNGTILTTNSEPIHVKGVVNGQITVISDNHIYVENDVVYASDPGINPNSDDFLGLAADNKIIIPDDPAMVPNLRIDAAILANERFEVEHYNSGSPRGFLTIFGSLIVKDDQESGTYAGGILQTGFDRKLIYDQRLIDKTPPFFPRLNRVEILWRSD